MGYAKTAVALLALLSLAATPASQPTGDDAPAARRRLAEVVAQNATMAARIKVLEAEVAELRQQIAASTPKPAAADEDVKPESTFTSRAEKAKRDDERYAKNLASAKKLDAAIAALDASPTIKAAMYEARIVPGMTIDQVKMLSDPKSWYHKTETANQIEFKCYTGDPNGDSMVRNYRVLIASDIVQKVGNVY